MGHWNQLVQTKNVFTSEFNLHFNLATKRLETQYRQQQQNNSNNNNNKKPKSTKKKSNGKAGI